MQSNVKIIERNSLLYIMLQNYRINQINKIVFSKIVVIRLSFESAYMGWFWLFLYGFYT
jgi:hypothetical protein